MIIQCEKCKTRFKLDDSRVTEAGIRVRCSRCSHTFVVRRESPEEESDFESILQGFGGNASPGEDDGNDSLESEFSSDQAAEETGLPRDEEFDVAALSSADASADGDDNADSRSWDSESLRVESSPVELPQEAAEENTQPVLSETPEPPYSETLRKGAEQSDFQVSPDFDLTENISAPKDDGEDFGIGRLFDHTPVQSTSQTDEESDVQAALPPVDLLDNNSPQIVSDDPVSTHSARERLWPVADSKEEESMDDTLSPLSIASRRKSSPFRPILLGVLLILLVGGAVYYLSSLRAGNVGDMLPESATEMLGLGKKVGAVVQIRSLEGTFLANRDAGEIFVMKGDAFNVSSVPLTTIQVRGKVYGPNGEILAQQTVYCGNVLSREQLAQQPYSSMVHVLSNQFGETLANFQVQPGTGVPFVVVLKDVPSGAKDFGVEVVSPMGPIVR